jgi:hypothetical protein
MITGQVMKTLTTDLKDLWTLYEQLLSLLMKESNSGSTDVGATESLQEKLSIDNKNKKDVLDALNFYKEHYEEVSNSALSCPNFIEDMALRDYLSVSSLGKRISCKKFKVV